MHGFLKIRDMSQRPYLAVYLLVRTQTSVLGHSGVYWRSAIIRHYRRSHSHVYFF